MILGLVGPDGSEARIDVVVRGPSGAERAISAVIDTGFTDQLTLPESLVDELGLDFAGAEPGVLANGQRVLINVYQGEVVWDGRRREVTVLATAGTPLVGMRLLLGHHLGLDVRPGGSVQIVALSSG